MDRREALAVVIIPIYKTRLNDYEIIGVDSAFSNLCDYTIVFVAPASLDTEWYSERFPLSITVRFDDAFFRGYAGYNRLLLSPMFYERFVQYEYMLVCQTDVYIIGKDLERFCDAGYDYIGAPMDALFEADSLFYVGNGGCSLRKIRAVYSFLNRNNSLAERWERNEDSFFAIVGKGDSMFNIAPFELAIQFAFDRFAHFMFERNHQRAPFAIHAWYKPLSEFSSSLIATKTYPPLDYTKERFEISQLKSVFSINDKWIWGIGYVGRTLIEFLSDKGIEGFIISDGHNKNPNICGNRSILFFSEAITQLKNKTIIMAISDKYRYTIDEDKKRRLSINNSLICLSEGQIEYMTENVLRRRLGNESIDNT